jgi:hypothetical protein
MEITKHQVGSRWVVIQRWPRQFQKMETEFPTEAQADQWIAEAGEIAASVHNPEWRKANDFAKNIVNQTLGSDL